MHGKLECIRFLIDSGADVNIANDSGYTPLICSAKIGDYEAVSLLLDAGAEEWHTLKNEDGSPSVPQRTALILAGYNRHYRVVELLQSAGTKPLAGMSSIHISDPMSNRLTKRVFNRKG